MPESSLRLVADHGEVPADSVHGHNDLSPQVLERLQELGIDYNDVVQGLEDAGVATFGAVWEQLGDQLAATLRAQLAQ